MTRFDVGGVRLSVAIATCGRPDQLDQCLEALARQTRLPDEVIVVDQDPLPETFAVIRRSSLPIDYYEQPRLGLSASRNLALSKARADVLAVTDDDCMADPEWVEALVEAFSSTTPPPDAVTGAILSPPGDPPEGMYAFSLRTSRESKVFDRRQIPWGVGSGANFAASLSMLRKIGGWDERLGTGTGGMAAEDCEIIDRLLSNNGTIRYEPRAVIRHAWQTRTRRKATRWSYGYGIGALCGLRLAQGDKYGLHMLAAYSRMHMRTVIRQLARLNLDQAAQRLTALAALMPGCLYGLRTARQPAVQSGALKRAASRSAK